MAYLNYEKLLDEAYLAVVKGALSHAQRQGLEEPHHFYITFLTTYPGVELPQYLKEEYPDEMPIVLQYEFFDLKVKDQGFSVVLNFNDVDETIYVPFESIVHFSDPSENFSLEFAPEAPKASSKESGAKSSTDNVVSIDNFRKK